MTTEISPEVRDQLERFVVGNVGLGIDKAIGAVFRAFDARGAELERQHLLWAEEHDRAVAAEKEAERSDDALAQACAEVQRLESERDIARKEVQRFSDELEAVDAKRALAEQRAARVSKACVDAYRAKLAEIERELSRVREALIAHEHYWNEIVPVDGVFGAEFAAYRKKIRAALSPTEKP